MLYQNSKKKHAVFSDFGLSGNYVRKPLSEIIYEDLKGRIVRGEIGADQRLQEDNLAKVYQTSRTPIRDALRKLEQENIIEKLAYGGYKIKKFTMQDIEEIFGIRLTLESYAAVLATSHISENEIKEMGKILIKSGEAIKSQDTNVFVELNTKFHSCLYNASGSKHLLRILDSLWDYFYRYRRIIFQSTANMEKSLKGHKMILEKMRERNHKAVEELMKEHLASALSDLKQELSKSSDSSLH